ncbi:hypothetical protein [Acrocarpospora catenulata]|uniref:hypothetical protein n=1 Tax=Acrocarpospora catenulata TaxID=2836182 RepID=UPI001BD9E381|nr:hypothetical protein [Acrocarpospora catenulata]
MNAISGLRNRTKLVVASLAGTAVLGAGIASATVALSTPDVSSIPAVQPPALPAPQGAVPEGALFTGTTTASYFWDDGSGRAGDTGMPAIGKPMQKGLAASPSWPLGTEGYVTYLGKEAKFFVGDRGPGEPSERGVMLDLDAKTFAELTNGDFDHGSLTVKNNGGKGHINISYKITKWGEGTGRKGAPAPFSARAWND